MKLFEDIQRVTEVETKRKVVVSASFSLVLDNKTDVTILILSSQQSFVGYPLLAGETIEVENIPQASEFYVFIPNTEIEKNQGLYIISRPFLDSKKPEENNTVIFNRP